MATWNVLTFGPVGFANQGNQNRTITSVPATNNIVINASFGGGASAAQIHDIIIQPKFVAANPLSDYTTYTIVGINSQTDLLLKPNDGAPDITAVPSDASLQKINRGTPLSTDSAITAAFTADTVTVGGSTFETDGVHRGDRVSIAGSTSNDGAWVVKNVISETVIQITGTFTVEAAAGTCMVDRAEYWLDIIDPPATMDWATVVANVPAGMASEYTVPANSTLARHYDHHFGQIRTGYVQNVLQALTPVTTAFAADGVVIASGALFVTNGVGVGDIVRIGGGINSGIYTVLSVDSETQITVDATFVPQSTVIDAARTITNIQVIGGTFRVTAAGATYSTDPIAAEGSIATIVGSTSNDGTYTVDSVQSAAVLNMKEPGTAEPAAGTMAVDVGVEVWDQQRFDWDSPAELVRCLVADMAIQNLDLGSESEPESRITIGTDGGDIYGTQDSSVWAGVSVNGTPAFLTTDIYGSAMVAAGGWSTSNDGDAKCSLITGQYTHPTFVSSGGNSESVLVVSDALGAVSFGVVDSQNNLTVSRAPSFSVIIGANVRLQGLIISLTGTANPFLATLGANVDIVDAREDYTMTRLFSLFGGADIGQKLYTYAPTFVQRDEANLIGIPIEGLNVRISSINETTQVETVVAEFVTDSNGQINGGDGYETLRGFKQGGGTPIDYSVRVLVEGTGFRTINQVIQLKKRFEGDVIVDLLRPDFEGELST